MSDTFWFDGVSPADGADVLAVRPTAAGTDALVAYRSRTPWRTGSPWTPLEPPGVPSLLTGHATAGGLAAVVAAGPDRTIRATTGGPDAPGWVDLGRPGFADTLASVEVTTPAGPQRFVAVVDTTGALWVRLDPAGDPAPDSAAWEQVPTPDGSPAAVVTAVAAPGPHLVAALRSATSFSTRPAVLTGAPGAWQWVDPGPPPGGVEVFDCVAATVDGTGFAAFRGWPGPDLPLPVLVLHGSGTAWTWTAVGHPPGDDELFVDGITAAAPSAVVVAHRGGHLWLGGLDGTWTDLGLPDPAGPVRVATASPAPPAPVVVTSDGPRVWSIDTADPAPAWTELPSSPSTVDDAVGGVAIWDDATAGESGGWILFLVGGDGRLWARRWEGKTWLWDDHGTPAPGVTVRGSGGTLSSSHVAVLGSDGALWHRIRSGPDWSWIAHGNPGGGPLLSVAPPVLVPGETQVRFCVLGGDGRLRVRSSAAAGWHWDDRGTPPGSTVFTLVGAAAGPGPAGGPAGLVGFVITDDGKLWGSWLEAAGPHWTGLGTPGPGLIAAAGIGVVGVTAADGASVLRIAVMDVSTRHVRVASWPPGDPWLDVAPPPGVAVVGTLGAVAVPSDPTAAHVFVLGSDGHAWQLRVVSGSGTWTDWGAPPDATPLRGRAALATIEDHSPVQRIFPLVCATDSHGSMHMGWPSA